MDRTSEEKIGWLRLFSSSGGFASASSSVASGLCVTSSASTSGLVTSASAGACSGARRTCWAAVRSRRLAPMVMTPGGERRGVERRGEEKVVTLSSANSKFYVAVTNERDGRTDFLPCRESWFVWERKEGRKRGMNGNWNRSDVVDDHYSAALTSAFGNIVLITLVRGNILAKNCNNALPQRSNTRTVRASIRGKSCE